MILRGDDFLKRREVDRECLKACVERKEGSGSCDSRTKLTFGFRRVMKNAGIAGRGESILCFKFGLNMNVDGKIRLYIWDFTLVVI